MKMAKAFTAFSQVAGIASSDLTFNSAQLLLLLQGVQGACKAAGEASEKISEKAMKLAKTKNIKGNKWTQISDCLNTFYGNTAKISIIGAIQLLSQGITDYYSGFLTFETACDAVISTSELDMLSKVVEPRIPKLDTIAAEVEKIVVSVNDISRQTYHDEDISNPAKDLKTYLDDISVKTKEAEAAASATVAAISDLLTNVAAVIDARENITEFSKENYLSGQSYKNLSNSFSTAVTQLQTVSQRNQDKDAGELINGVVEEWHERQEEAARKKRWLGIATTVLGTIAGVALPGVGAVFVGAIGGGISSIVSAYEDQWADIGRAARGSYDIGSIAVDGFMGTLKGGIMGYVGGQFAGWSSGASFLGKVGLGIGNEMVTNVVDEGFELAGAKLKTVTSTDPELKALHQKELDEKWDQVTDPAHWGEIGFKSVVTGTSGAVLGEAFDLIPTDFNSKFGTVLSKTGVGMGKKIVTKGVERVTDGMIEFGFQGKNIWQGAKDGFKSITGADILTWAVQGGVEAGIPAAYENYSSRFNDNMYVNEMKRWGDPDKGPSGYWAPQTKETVEPSSGDGANIYNAKTGEYSKSQPQGPVWVSTADKVEKGRITGIVKGTSKGIRWEHIEKEEMPQYEPIDVSGLTLLDPR